MTAARHRRAVILVLDGVGAGADDRFLATGLVDPLRVTHAAILAGDRLGHRARCRDAPSGKMHA